MGKRPDEAALVDALLPFALALDHSPNAGASDDAFIWEADIGHRPVVTYGNLRAAHRVLKRLEACLGVAHLGSPQ